METWENSSRRDDYHRLPNPNIQFHSANIKSYIINEEALASSDDHRFALGLHKLSCTGIIPSSQFYYRSQESTSPKLLN